MYLDFRCTDVVLGSNADLETSLIYIVRWKCGRPTGLYLRRDDGKFEICECCRGCGENPRLCESGLV